MPSRSNPSNNRLISASDLAFLTAVLCASWTLFTSSCAVPKKSTSGIMSTMTPSSTEPAVVMFYHVNSFLALLTFIRPLSTVKSPSQETNTMLLNCYRRNAPSAFTRRSHASAESKPSQSAGR